MSKNVERSSGAKAWHRLEVEIEYRNNNYKSDEPSEDAAGTAVVIIDQLLQESGRH